MNQEKWLICPICGSKIRLKLGEDTISGITQSRKSGNCTDAAGVRHTPPFSA